MRTEKKPVVWICTGLCIAWGGLGADLPSLSAQVTTPGFLNLPRNEAPGTLLSSPAANDSQNIGRTTTLSYVNGWLVVGAEEPGSAAGSDNHMRVYDISNPSAPVRRFPSDFQLSYPGNRWHSGNFGWNAHGTAQSGNLLLPNVIRVQTHGGPVELGGTNGIPLLSEVPVGYDRPSQAGPWGANMLWYNTPDQDILIRRATRQPGQLTQFQTLATIDHVGTFGGGDWHPMFFGDLLICARSGGAARDGVVVYRLQYNQFDDANPANDTITPDYVDSLPGGFSGYWPVLFSDGTGLFVIGSNTNILTAANITAAADPATSGEGRVVLTSTLTVPGFTNASYPVFQDQFGFIHNRKIDMSAFLAGDADPIVLTLNEGAPHNVDTTQMSLPLGNLWITGGYPHPGRSQGMAVWVHQQAPDTTRPTVAYHIPQVGRANYPRHAPLSFLLHEHPRHGGLRNGTDFAVRPVLANGSLGTHVPGFLIHDFSGVLTFTPDQGLAAGTTYQVDFFSNNSNPQNPIGFFDAAGNPIEPYSYRFSTGGSVNAPAPPVMDSLVASHYQPALQQQITVTATGSGASPLEFRFNFEGVWTPWSSQATAAYAYTETGRKRVLAQMRDASGTVATRPLNLLVANPPPALLPTQSSSMAVGDDPAGRRLWVVNPDANSVSVLNPASGALVAEHSVGENPRSIARDGQGRYWVTCMGSDQIRVLNPNGTIHTTVTLPYGSAPFGVAPSPDGSQLFVTLYGSGQLRRYSAANPSANPVIRTTFPTPRALAVSANGQRVLVTRFLSPDLEAEIGEFLGTSDTLNAVRTFRLSSANTLDNGDRAAGVPNYLAGIAISPDGTRAAVVSKQDNVQRGLFFGVADLTHETTVRAVISFLDLANNTEIRHARRDFDNSDSPAAVAYTPLGDTLLVALQGNNRIVGLDAFSLAPVVAPETVGSTETSPAVLSLDLATGLAPQGVLLDPVSQRLFSQDFMGRTVTVRNAVPLLTQNQTSLPLVATTATVGNELLSNQVLLGKRIFYNAADARMSADSYISCASCHVDGGHDGRVWDFTGRGEGLRRTPDLRGRAGTGQGNVHWSGNFDEIQDFEHDIRGPFGGTGFLPLTPSQFAAQHPSPATPKAGASVDLDAVAAYVASLGASSVPRSPYRNADGTMTVAAERGRGVFQGLNCNSCHSGTSFTNSASTPVNATTLSAVGTQSALSGQRLGQILGGIDTPTLKGLHTARNYLHHGQARTLEEVFTYAGGSFLLASQAQSTGAGPLGVATDNPTEGGGGFFRGALGGTSVALTGGAGQGVRFSQVQGGPNGGPARISLRYIRQYSPATARLRVNGVEQTLNLLRQYPDNNWQVSGWQWITVDATLNANATNTIEILPDNLDILVNALLVSPASNLAAASPHRNVQTLSAGDRADLLTYLQQLDSQAEDAGVPPSPDSPTVAITPVSGTPLPLNQPYVDLDVVFSVPVTGLMAEDFVLGGTTGATLTHLTAYPGGTHYRLRVAGFTQAGNLTIQLPQGAAGGAVSGLVNVSSALKQITYSPPVVDDLAPLSDEFEDPATLAQWQNNNAVEGWNANKLEQWNIDTTTPGRMRLMPYASTWFQDFTGAYVFKQVTGDFVLTTRLDVARRNGLPGRPTSDFSLAGLMVRAPRNITAAAPQPNFGPATVLPWPPPAQGQANHYATDWQPASENYIFLSYGFGNNSTNNNPNQWQYEVKTTTNGISTLYPRALGVPVGESNAWLQVVRRGSTFLLLRRHGAGPWIIENRFERPDLPQTLQVGLTTYTDWNTVSAGWNYSSPVQPYHQNRIVNTGLGSPDVVADVEFFRLRRPDPALTAAALQGVGVTGPNGPVAALDGTPLVSYLGDASASALPAPGQTLAQWLGSQLTPSQLVNPANTDPQADPLGRGLANVVQFLAGGSPARKPYLAPVEDGAGGSVLRLHLDRNPLARGWRWIIQTSTDLLQWTTVATSEDGAVPTGPGYEGEVTGNPPTQIIGPGAGTEEGAKRFYRTQTEPMAP